MAEDKSMQPVCSKVVATDDSYANEWGREELLQCGEQPPADAMVGDTEWTLNSLLPENREQEQYKDRTTYKRPRVQIGRSPR
jgi:hypothetical protein